MKCLKKVLCLSLVIFASNICFASGINNINTKMRTNLNSTKEVAKKISAGNKNTSSATTPIVMQHYAIRLNPAQMKKIQPVTGDKKVAKGVDPEKYIALRDVLKSKDAMLLEDIDRIASWDSDLIFQDKEASHVFYYIPKKFLLINEDENYSLGVQYNQTDDSSKPSVTFTADLSINTTPGDTALLKGILRNALGLDTKTDIEVKSISGIGMEVDVSSITTGLSIPEDRVQVITPKHLRDKLRIVFLLKQDETEAFLTQIAHEGLSGTIKAPVGKSTVDIGFTIKYKEFFGKYTKEFQKWWLSGEEVSELTNNTLFPITFSSINAYTLDSKGELKRVSKKLGSEITIDPGKSKKFKIPSAKKVLGSNLLTAWLNVELQDDCEDCIAAAKEKVNRGISVSPTTPITFEAIPSVFEENEIYKIILSIKSPYFIADRNKVIEKTVTLSEEESTGKLSIFFPENKGNEPLLFKYKIKIIKSDGQSISSTGWTKANETSLLLGSYQLEELLEEE